MKKKIISIALFCLFISKCHTHQLPTLAWPVAKVSLALAVTYVTRFAIKLNNENHEGIWETLIYLGDEDREIIINIASHVFELYKQYNDSIAWTPEDIQSYCHLIQTCSNSAIQFLINNIPSKQ